MKDQIKNFYSKKKKKKNGKGGKKRFPTFQFFPCQLSPSKRAWDWKYCELSANRQTSGPQLILPPRRSHPDTQKPQSVSMADAMMQFRKSDKRSWQIVLSWDVKTYHQVSGLINVSDSHIGGLHGTFRFDSNPRRLLGQALLLLCVGLHHLSVTLVHASFAPFPLSLRGTVKREKYVCKSCATMPLNVAVLQCQTPHSLTCFGHRTLLLFEMLFWICKEIFSQKMTLDGNFHNKRETVTATSAYASSLDGDDLCL